jgi:hypothetical protein
VIPCLPATVDRREAEAIVAGSSGEFSARVERRVFFPYHRLHFRCSARTLFGESAVKVLCLVDARTGVASTIDPFEMTEIDAPADELIDDRIDETDAREIAERYVGYVMRTKRKALIAPKTEVVEVGVIHKPFWIVRCTNGSKPSFRVLVDGVTGGFFVLGNMRNVTPAV